MTSWEPQASGSNIYFFAFYELHEHYTSTEKVNPILIFAELWAYTCMYGMINVKLPRRKHRCDKMFRRHLTALIRQLVNTHLNIFKYAEQDHVVDARSE